MATLNLKKREKVMLAGAAVVLLLGAAMYVQDAAWWKAYRNSGTVARAARDRLDDVRQWQRALEEQRASQEAIRDLTRGQDPSFDLWSFINSAVRDTELENRAELQSRTPESYRLPQQVAVAELELTGVSLQELVDFFHRVYAADSLVAVQEMSSLQPTRDNQGLACRLLFVAPR